MVNSRSRIATRSTRRTHTKQTRSLVATRGTATRGTATRVTTTKTTNNYFMTNEGDDNIESSFSFLIGLMGSSAFELYVRDFNAEYGQNVQVVQVESPMNVFKNPLTPEEIDNYKPTIYYGKRSATHFTCSTDGKHLQNSYTDFQIKDTDHFCQTFALMYVVHAKAPESYIANEYRKLRKGKFLDNAFIAKNVACNVVSYLWNKYPDEMYEIIYKVIQPQPLLRDDGFPLVRKPKETPDDAFYRFIENFNRYLKFCASITKAQICKSTFKEKVFLLVR